MQKVKVFYRNGAMIVSSPMNQWEANAFKRKFDGDRDVFSVELVSVEKEPAQAEFRTAAAEWKAIVERNRDGGVPFNRAIDELALRNYQRFISVGCSG